MKLIFAGTPVFAQKHLEVLVDSAHDVCAVYTQPDRPAGRGKKVQASPVKQLATSFHIPVFQPASLKPAEVQRELSELNADLMVVVAYGLILPATVLEAPRLGCINVHGSILPAWRGAAPIQRAIEAGDTTGGVTIMQMDEGLDTGAMLLKAHCDISNTDNSADLHDKLCDIGPNALLTVIDQLASGTATPTPQDHSNATYAHKIEKSEAQIQWHEAAHIIARKIRAFNPFPVCYCLLNDQRIKIHRARVLEESNLMPHTEPGNIGISGEQMLVHCGKGLIAIEELQLPGKKTMQIKDFLNGPGQHIDLVKFGSQTS